MEDRNDYSDSIAIQGNNLKILKYLNYNLIAWKLKPAYLSKNEYITCH